MISQLFQIPLNKATYKKVSKHHTEANGDPESVNKNRPRASRQTSNSSLPLIVKNSKRFIDQKSRQSFSAPKEYKIIDDNSDEGLKKDRHPGSKHGNVNRRHATRLAPRRVIKSCQHNRNDENHRSHSKQERHCFFSILYQSIRVRPFPSSLDWNFTLPSVANPMVGCNGLHLLHRFPVTTFAQFKWNVIPRISTEHKINADHGRAQKDTNN